MRKTIILLTTVFFLLSLTACGLTTGSPGDSRQESPPADMITVEEPPDTTTGSSSTPDGPVTLETQWPEALGLIPVFTYGQLVSVIRLSDSFEGIDYTDYQINIVIDGMEAGEHYAADLEAAGFTPIGEPMRIGDEISYYVQYSFSKDTVDSGSAPTGLKVDYWVDNDNAGTVYISVPKTAGSASVSETPANATVNIQNSTAVPDDYPLEDVPLFGLEDGEMIGSSREDMGDLGTVYIVAFGVNQDVAAAADQIGSRLEQYAASEGGAFDALMDPLFMGRINGCEFAVTIGDGASDGYRTVVSYTVTRPG